MRHGKSSWKKPELDDYDRPLKKRGSGDAKNMAERLMATRLLPDLVLSSSALRTRQTAEIVNSCFHLSKIAFLDNFYLAQPETILNFLAEMEDTLQRIMVIGHNPCLELLISLLTGEHQRFPTAAVAVIDLDISNWQNLSGRRNCGKLIHLWRPKEIISEFANGAEK